MAQGDVHKDLVDSPNETLSVDYKSWLNFSGEIEPRADTARHIAAIANHGGGVIVFGFNDDLSPAAPCPFSLIDRDTIAGIVKKYLEPTFHCDVDTITSALGNLHPIIIIPSHGATPICAKANGPEVGGKIRGIIAGTYYVRKPGPESDRVVTAAEWAPIIRRCALYDRTSILNALEAAIRGAPTDSAKSEIDELNKWHEAGKRRYKEIVTDCKALRELLNHNIQFSYLISRADGQRLNPDDLRNTLLLQMNNEVRDRVRTGWSMLYPFNPKEIAPYVMIDEQSGEAQEDFIECSLIQRETRLDMAADMWRVTTGGKVTLVRPYWEDDSNWGARVNVTPFKTFNPKNHVRSVAEIVRHAQAFA